MKVQVWLFALSVLFALGYVAAARNGWEHVVNSCPRGTVNETLWWYIPPVRPLRYGRPCPQIGWAVDWKK